MNYKLENGWLTDDAGNRNSIVMTQSDTGLDETLQPCPFCGGKGRTDRTGPTASALLWRAGCADNACIGAGTRWVPHGWDTEAEAIAAWNRRPAPTEAVTVGVKALEWSELTSPREDGPGEPNGNWEAETPFGFYQVEMVADYATVWGLSFGPEEEYIGGDRASPDEAKAAAQADYTARIMSAIDITNGEAVGAGIVDDVHRDMIASGDRIGAHLARDLLRIHDAYYASPATGEGGTRPIIHEASDRIGAWLSAALDDPGVAPEMKADINAWFAAGQPLVTKAPGAFDEVVARAWDFVRPKLSKLNKEKGLAGVWSNGFRSGWTAALPQATEGGGK